MPTDRWVIMPFIDLPEMTWQAVEDCLAQTLPVRVLLVDQGSSPDTRRWIDHAITEQNAPFRSNLGPADYQPPQVLCWHFTPPLPSLSAVWNRALQFVWDLGGTEALVINNDVRIRPDTLAMLSTVLDQTVSLFVSGVGVREAQYQGSLKQAAADLVGDLTNLGGPDFSCFLISKAGHLKYAFDEAFIPAYCEDVDMHRRWMLGGDGDKIFSVNLPYLHYASQTLNSRTPPEQQQLRERLAGSSAYYQRKWGGPVNQEQWLTPFNRPLFEADLGWNGLKRLGHYPTPEGTDVSARAIKVPVTTPELQAWWQREGEAGRQSLALAAATRAALRTSYEDCIAEGEPILDMNLLGLPPDVIED